MPLFGSMATKGKGMATIPDQAGTPSITSQVSGSIGLSWTAPTFTGGAPLIDYKLEYSTNSGSSWTTYSHAAGWATSITTTGLTDYLTYIWRVSAINAVGSGAVSANSAGAAQFNAASGGTEATITNYNSTGQTWKVHTFTSTGAINPTISIHNYQVLCVAGGGAASGNYGSGGGGGGMLENSYSITTGSKIVTVGDGGPGGYVSGVAASGGTSSLQGVVSTTGGGGGASQGYVGGNGGSGGGSSRGNTPGSGISGQGYQGWPGNDSIQVTGAGGGAGGSALNSTPGPGRASSITGSSVLYAGGGSGVTYGQNNGFSFNGYGGGGGAENRAGTAGIVVVAYRIA